MITTNLGTAAAPLESVIDPCPGCAGRLDATLTAPMPSVERLARATLTPGELDHFARICEVRCPGCGWAGSAYRP